MKVCLQKNARAASRGCCQDQAALKWEFTGGRTRDPVAPMHFITVSAAVASTKVQRLMHIANEMDEELERFLCQLGGSGRRGGR